MTIKEIREAEKNMIVALSLPASDAEKIIKFYSQKQDKNGVSGCGALDADIIKAASDVVGVVLPPDYKKRLQLARMAQGIGTKKPKKTKSDKNNAENVNAEKKADNSAVYSDADIKDSNDINGGGALDDPKLEKGYLPPALLQTLENIINNWCINNDVENMRRAASLQWGAVCMYIGQYIKNNKILYDIQKSAARGGGCFYDPLKVEKLVDIWVYLCQKYNKIPLVTDFIYFSGVSDTWLYNQNGHSELSSAGGGIAKKLSKIQAAALASGIVDGRENPTGKIYFTKAVLGWSDNGGGQIMEEKNKNNLDVLPVFDSLPGTKNT